MAPADGSHAGHQAHPVGGQDENEDRGEEPERPFRQVRPDDPLQKIVKALDQPLPEVLDALRHLLHLSSGDVGKEDEARRHDPGHQHRVRDGKRPPRRLNAVDFDRLLRQTLLRPPGRDGWRRHPLGRGHGGLRPAAECRHACQKDPHHYDSEQSHVR